jgi:2-dehydro-3-deoxyphosphooctonate aldolase (KDO 8-P synthase)
MSTVIIDDQVRIGDGPMAVIAGPCVLETRDLTLAIGRHLAGLCARQGLPYIFKASFDKANRSSGASFRGPGLEEGLAMLRDVRDTLGVPVLTDVHEAAQVPAVAEVADILQIPAYLCRQTDLLLAAARSGRVVNIKKGQFMAPDGMAGAVDKVRQAGNDRVLLTERGATFGYHNLVVDMRALVIMRAMGVPVVFDATHSVQLPGGLGHASGGQREFILPLARAAAAVGIDALFLEVHPEPDQALSDGPNSADFALAERIIKEAAAIHELAR